LDVAAVGHLRPLGAPAGARDADFSGAAQRSTVTFCLPDGFVRVRHAAVELKGWRCMTTAVRPIPEGYEQATPYLSINGAARAIEFYKQAFGATEVLRLAMPDGRIGHAEIRIGRARIMLADEFPEMGFRAPRTLGGSPVTIHLYVEDVDALAARAVAAGATVKRPVQDQFYGDRSVTLEDPFGHVWSFATHKEDVSPEELRQRHAALYGAA
jgi:PhnB protein